MRTKRIVTLVLVLGLALVSTWAVRAQGPQPPQPQPPEPLPTAEGAGWEGKPFVRPLPAGGTFAAQGITPAAIPLGQPGTVFRYVQTFGVTREPFIETNDHFYNVEGIGIDGNTIWIADSWGSRVVKFDADGNFLQKIGKAGVIDSTGTSLDYIYHRHRRGCRRQYLGSGRFCGPCGQVQQQRSESQRVGPSVEQGGRQ